MHEIVVPGWGFANRESVYLCAKQPLPDGSYLLAESSAEHPDYPEGGQGVRTGRNGVTHLQAVPTCPGQMTQYVALATVQPGGYIPNWVTAQVSSGVLSFWCDAVPKWFRDI